MRARGGGRGTLLVTVLAVAAVPVASPAGHDHGKGKANGQRPRLESQVSARANDAGWFSEPVRAAVWAARPHGGLLERCVLTDTVLHPDGVQTSSRTMLLNAEPGECRLDVEVTSTRVETITVEALHRRWTAQRTVELRVDLEDPTVEIERAMVADGGDASFSGPVADAFSGPVAVVLLFEETSGRADPFVDAATCDGCTAGDPCSAARAPRCGRSASWTHGRHLTAGTWRVTPIARDLAGNEVRGTPRTVVVPFEPAMPTAGVNRPKPVSVIVPHPPRVPTERIIG